MAAIRQIYYYEGHYLAFFEKLSNDEQKKFNWTLQLITELEIVPAKFLKYLVNTDGLYEIRVEYGSNIFRVFCFFDQGQLVILLNGFKKKSQKTPRREIKLAQKLKDQYFHEKENQ